MPFKGEQRPQTQGGFQGEQRPRERGPVEDTIFQAITKFPQGAWGAAAQMGGKLPGGPSFLGTTADDIAKLAEVLGAKGAREATTDVRRRFGGAGMTADEWQQMGNQNLIEPALQQDAQLIEALQGRKGSVEMAPQTTAGRFGAATGGAMGGAVAGGPARALPNMIGAALSGVASEGAGQAVESQPDWRDRTLFPGGPSLPDTARTVAGAVTGAAGGMVSGGPRAAARMGANATPGMSEAAQNAVTANMRRGAQVGMAPTLAEAVDYTVPGARMGALARSAEGTPAGIETLGPRYRARPGQTRQVIAQILDRLGPQRLPSEVGLGAQGAAEGAIENTRKAINAYAKPNYDALRGEQVPAAQWADMIVGDNPNPTMLRALNDLRKDPVLNNAVADLPDRNLAVLNEAMKRAQTREQQATPEPGKQGTDQTLAGALRQGIGSWNARLSDVSPNWRQARDTVASGNENILNPLKAGPVGAISRTNDPATQMQALYPQRPLEGAPGGTSGAVSMMGQSGADLTRAHLAQQLDQATRNIEGQPNTFAPGTFAANVGGRADQRANLMAGTTAANPQAAAQLGAALDAFDTVATRKAEGSTTAANLRGTADIQSGGQLANAVIGGGSKRMLLDRLTNWADQIGVEMNQKSIVDMINADPDKAAKLLREIEAARNNPLQQRALIGGIIGAQGANTERLGQ